MVLVNEVVMELVKRAQGEGRGLRRPLGHVSGTCPTLRDPGVSSLPPG
jgi:hypothetical protein